MTIPSPNKCLYFAPTKCKTVHKIYAPSGIQTRDQQVAVIFPPPYPRFQTSNRRDPLWLRYDDCSPHFAIVILFQHDTELIQTDRLNQIAAE
jgi:hypothetical protein